MKMTEKHYREIKQAINILLEAHPELPESYIAGDFYRSELVKDIDKRYRWDLLNFSNISAKYICDNLYSYLNDIHIDTALKSIVKPLIK